MIKGVKLTLLMGPVVAFPVPRAVLDALQSVTVTSSATGQSGFQLSFASSSRSPLNTIFLIAGGETPLLRVIIVVTINSTPHVLMDGVVTHHEVQPDAASGTSTLSVTGKDLTKAMDLQDFAGLPYPAMPVFARVALICAKYAVLGLVPMVIPPLFPDLPIPIDRIPTHKGTDLDYVQKLAHDAGYVFYIDPGPVPGTNTAYFGPQIKVGVPQPALNINMDAHTNVESMSFRFETSETKLPVLFIQNALTRLPIPIPIPSINPLQPPLGMIPPAITGIDVLHDTARLSPMDAISRGLAEASRSQDAVKCDGELDVVRYGRLLRARQLVGVRGVGEALDGLYYVDEVKSTIKAGEIKQSFSLSRNGIVSMVPRVPV